MYGYKPRYHGNGFCQLYLNPKTRLHVFHPGVRARRVENSRIHDHRWDMYSHVLLGMVHHKVFKLTEDKAGSWRLVCPTAASKVAPLVEHPTTYRMQTIGECKMSAGSSYSFPARNFHRSSHTGLTMTVIHKGADDGNPARIVCPVGTVPEHAFLHQPSTDTLWEAYRDAYAQWNKQA